MQCHRGRRECVAPAHSHVHQVLGYPGLLCDFVGMQSEAVPVAAMVHRWPRLHQRLAVHVGVPAAVATASAALPHAVW
jgi:hypothetical protein